MGAVGLLGVAGGGRVVGWLRAASDLVLRGMEVSVAAVPVVVRGQMSGCGGHALLQFLLRAHPLALALTLPTDTTYPSLLAGGRGSGGLPLRMAFLPGVRCDAGV